MSHLPETAAPVARAKSAGTNVVNTRAFELASRAGFVARGVVYAIIGLLALDVAVGHGGKITNQQGALRSIEHQPFGHLLLVLVAAGLAAYAVWRLFRAALGHGPEGADRGIERVGAIGSGIAYAALCAIAVQLLTGSSSNSGNTKKTASGVFAWPGGRWIIGAAGLVMIAVGVYQLVRGLGRKFLDDSRMDEMPRALEKWFTPSGIVGHVARAVVFGLVGVFLLKAAVDYKANEAIGLDGALAKLYHQSVGPWLLGFVAAGLIAFGLFSIVESRYRRI
jgi:uncharacterized protein DUF1206